MIMLKSQQTLQQNPAVWKWVPGLTQAQLFTGTRPPPSPGSRAAQKVCGAFHTSAGSARQAASQFLQGC